MRKVIQFVAVATLSSGFCDEGMWPLNQLPQQALEQKYGFEITPQWADRMREAAVRISHGGSGSFVSEQGLVLTNHHVASGAIYNASSAKHDYLKNGFYAAALEDEVVCQNIHIDVLSEIRDITNEIEEILKGTRGPVERERKRREAMILIKERVSKESGLVAEVVQMYQGTKIELYLYKRYTDVRLVMAPEREVASFGGDIENFEYPRQCFDYTFLRVYEDGKPLHTPMHLKFSSERISEDDLLFVFGNPGGTNRLLPDCELLDRRDRMLPMILDFLEKRIAALEAYAERGDEQKRQSVKLMSRYRNFQKVLAGEKRSLDTNPLDGGGRMGEYETLLAQTLESCFKCRHDVIYMERLAFHGCKSFGVARDLVRLDAELRKSSHLRLPEYCESELDKVHRSLLSDEPIYPGIEAALLQLAVDALVQQFGEKNPTIASVLKGPTCAEIIAQTKLLDVSERKKLLNNLNTVAVSRDPLIVLARKLDPLARALRKIEEADFAAIRRECYMRLMHERMKSTYPDATFTLRMSVGKMAGYTCEAGVLHPQSPIADLYATHEVKMGKPPYSLPKRWLKADLDQNVPVNFVTTHDIIGGNSGSPVVNCAGDLVGLIFDGNRYTFSWDYKYDDLQGRAISVSAEAIIQSLERIYRAERLLLELQ